jgi:hypothetical protein
MGAKAWMVTRGAKGGHDGEVPVRLHCMLMGMI